MREDPAYIAEMGLRLAGRQVRYPLNRMVGFHELFRELYHIWGLIRSGHMLAVITRLMGSPRRLRLIYGPVTVPGPRVPDSPFGSRSR